MKALLQRPYAAKGQYTKAKQWRASIVTFGSQGRQQPPPRTVVDSTESVEDQWAIDASLESTLVEMGPTGE